MAEGCPYTSVENVSMDALTYPPSINGEAMVEGWPQTSLDNVGIEAVAYPPWIKEEPMIECCQ